MLSISIRYRDKHGYATRALSPMLRSNSCQTETALSQVLGHDSTSRHTLLGKMLRHNGARIQNHSDTSIGLRQLGCAATCDMSLGKNHGSHFITIKSIGKTHYPVSLRFAANGSASVRSVPPPPKPATGGRRGSGNAHQSPAAPRRSVFVTHFGQTKARPLNEAPSKRISGRRRAAFWQNIALMYSQRSPGR